VVLPIPKVAVPVRVKAQLVYWLACLKYLKF
jgi:hypothetical protein